MKQDEKIQRDSVDHAWTALTHRGAAIVGSSAALISLLWHAPVTAACARGAVAWFAVRLLGRATSWVLARTAPPGVAAGRTPGTPGAKPRETS